MIIHICNCLYLGPEHHSRTLMYFKSLLSLLELLLLLLLFGPKHQGCKDHIAFQMFLFFFFFYYYSQWIAFLGALTYSKIHKILHTHQVYVKMINFMSFREGHTEMGSIALQVYLHHMLSPAEMKVVWLMYQPKIFKKVSWIHALAHTGSPLF